MFSPWQLQSPPCTPNQIYAFRPAGSDAKREEHDSPAIRPRVLNARCKHLCVSDESNTSESSSDIRDTSHVPEFLHPTRWIPRDLFSDRYDAIERVYSSAAPHSSGFASVSISVRSTAASRSSPNDDRSIHRSTDRKRGAERGRSLCNRSRAISTADPNERDEQSWKGTRARLNALVRKYSPLPDPLRARCSSKVHTCVSNIGKSDLRFSRRVVG